MTKTDLQDLRLADKVSTALVPTGWARVSLAVYRHACLDWVRDRELVLGRDFIMNVGETASKKHRKKWPFPDPFACRYHYFFRDPANATVFALTFA
jgi:hypothetical protein